MSKSISKYTHTVLLLNQLILLFPLLVNHGNVEVQRYHGDVYRELGNRVTEVQWRHPTR